MSSSSKFDIIVYGATGFTGQLVAEYLAAHYRNDPQLKWAMAGRSLDKLAKVRDEVGAPADTPLIAADSGDVGSLRVMVEQTRLVIAGSVHISFMEPIWLRPAQQRAPIISIIAVSRCGCGR